MSKKDSKEQQKLCNLYLGEKKYLSP